VLVKGVQAMHSRILSPHVLSLEKVELLKQAKKDSVRSKQTLEEAAAAYLEVKKEVEQLQGLVHKERASTDKANRLENDSGKAEQRAAQALVDAKSVKMRLAARRAAAQEAFRRAQGIAFFALEAGTKAQDAIDKEEKTKRDEEKLARQIGRANKKINSMEKELNGWKRKLVAQNGWTPWNQAS